MKKYLFIIALFHFINVAAQERHLTCGTNEQFNTQISNAQIKHSLLNRMSSVQIRVIPVVVHVLHEYGQNISDAQVRNAIDILTNDFRKLSADTIDIIPSFQSIAADCEIEFRLATLDPNGNCTNGIEHIVTPLTYNANDSSKINQWPNDKYLNIWVVSSLENSAAYGYSHLPGGANSTDGIMMIHSYIGNIGTGSLSNSRSLTHEVGHFFNLFHLNSSGTFGVSCGDDGIADTPITKGWDHCDLTGSICNPPIIENVQNFMEYSFCGRMFTHGQKARVDSLLNSSISGRNNLWTQQNLIATGTDSLTHAICSPVADFIPNPYYACAGSTINFINESWNATITSYDWSFPGGNPSSSIDSNPSVTYNTPGTYDATLIVTSANGSDTITKTTIVHISDSALISIPYTEDFENASSFPGIDGWLEHGYYSLVNSWMRDSTANFTTGGSHCIKMNNFSNVNGEFDSWITSSLDFSNVTSPRLSFEVAYAQRNSTTEDQLSVYYSIDCGKSWHGPVYQRSGAQLSTTGTYSLTSFTPSSTTQWRLEGPFAVNAIANKQNVRFKFENLSGGSNNIYVDDINITGTINSIDETDEMETGFTLFPNPTNSTSTVSFVLNKNSHVIVEVKNILGQKILSVFDNILSAGSHENKLPALTPGVYLIDVIVNDKHHLRKLVVS